jgi:hypothetical protein
MTAQTTDAQWSLFSSKSQTFGLGQTIWADNLGRQFLGHLGYFRPIYQHPFDGLKDIIFSSPSFNPGPFNPRHFNHELLNPGLFNREFLNHGVEKSGVEMSSL